MMPYQEFSVGIYGWWFGWSGVAVANCREDHKFECIHNFHLCHFRYFVVGLIGLEVGDWGKKIGNQGKEHLVHLCNGYPLVCSIWNMSIFICCTHSERSIHTSLSDVLATNFSALLFPKPWSVHQPVSYCPWVTVGLYFRLSPFSHKINNHMFCNKFLSYGGFLFTSVFQAILCGTALQQPNSSYWCRHTIHIEV